MSSTALTEAAADTRSRPIPGLRWWMIGQLVPMAVIGTLTAIGLKIIGVDLWLILGLLAALFNFIPNFGPLLSGVPAFLLALADSPTKAAWVVLLYVAAQSLEGYVLTPLVQRRAVELPPALLIQGTADANVTPDMADRFVAAYTEAGGAITLRTFEREPHTFISLYPTKPASIEAMGVITRFIREQTR